MQILSPSDTAESAAAIYRILLPGAVLHEFFPQALNDNFDLAGGTKLTGKSGGKII